MTGRVAVIGGGVTGCSVVWHLAERGIGDVVLIERDRIGSGTTWHSAGNITWKPLEDNDAPVHYMFDLIDRFEADGEQSTGWVRTGRLFLARSEADMELYAPMAAEGQARGYESAMLTPDEAAARHPLLDAQTIAGAWFNGLSGRLNPADLTACYARAARRAGAEIREQCSVEGLVATGGNISAVMTGDGPLEVNAVVVCAGLWSRDLLVPLGVELAQWGCQHFYVIADIDPRLERETPSFVSPADLVYGREEVGGLLFGCFDEGALSLEPDSLPEPFTFTLLEPNWDKFAPYFDKAAELFPMLVDAPIRQFVNGPESFTPDGNPLIGPVPEVGGLYVASGMNSRGVTVSGASGHIIADLVAGTVPRFGATAYAPDRFGTRAGDTAWLRQEASATPSRYYIEAHRVGT
ncbi:MAG: NAD(P)/FAD-dependent oxidoreductase [Hyphomicrobiales bacterium]